MSTKEYGTDKKSETNFSYLSIGSNIGDRLHYLSKSQIEIEKVIEKLPISTVMMGVPTYYTRLLQSQNLNHSLTKNIRLFMLRHY